VHRRKFIRVTAGACAGTLCAGGLYSAVEAKLIQVTRLAAPIPNLPPAFQGRTLAFLSDFHHSFVVPRFYLEHVVNVTNALAPDIIALGGDYVTSGERYKWVDGKDYIEPCFDILKKLRAPLGCFAVTGNHDAYVGINLVRAAITKAGFTSLINGGVWLTLDGQRLRICGIDDLRTLPSNPHLALGDATEKDAVIMVSHNPDAAEEVIPDSRTGLLLAGHTHSAPSMVRNTGTDL
jgi:hypothetical protein